MIDTVILMLPKSKVKNTNGTDTLGFEPQYIKRKSSFAKWRKNPSKNLIESGYYYPRLTGIQRMKDFFVKIEFSAPKLLFRNNLEELTDDDFNIIIDALHDRLLEMDINIQKIDLAEAKVSGIHYSKNIELQNGYTAQYVIRELAKTNKRKSFDNTDFRYSNDGQSLQMYSKAHSLVIYDKISDLNKSDKRAIDKDENKIQRSLFEELATKTEIVRFEVRLSEYRKLKKILEEVEYKESLVFNKLFSEKLSQKIVKLYWDKITNNSKICYLPITDAKQILEQICIKYPNTKPAKKLQLVSMCMLAKDERGLTELRSILFKNNSDRSWYRLMQEYKELSHTLSATNPRDWIGQIQEGFTNYKPIKNITNNK